MPVKSHMQQLCEKLGEMGMWRLHYVYPYPHVDDLIPLMAEGRCTALFRYSLPTRKQAYIAPDEASAVPIVPLSESKMARTMSGTDHSPTFIAGFPVKPKKNFKSYSIS